MDEREPWDALPTVEAVLAELRADGQPTIRDEWIKEVSVVATPTLADSQVGWQSEHNVELAAWHVRIPYESPFRPRTLCHTIVQIAEGGLSGGEGWGLCQRWVIRGHLLTEEELVLIGRLLIDGGAPVLTFSQEL